MGLLHLDKYQGVIYDIMESAFMRDTENISISKAILKGLLITLQPMYAQV